MGHLFSDSVGKVFSSALGNKFRCQIAMQDIELVLTSNKTWVMSA